MTRNNIIKYWELSIGMCQSSSANIKRAMVYEGVSGVSDNREDDQCGWFSDLR